MKTTILFMAAASCAASLMAQAQQPPPVLQFIHETIKEGKLAAHVKSEQAWVSAFRKNKYSFHYVGLSSMSGPNEVIFVEAFPSFAALAQADVETDKQPLKGESEQADARDGEYRASSRRIITAFRKDLSYLPENSISVGKTRYIELLTYRLRIGRNEEFENGAKMLLDAYAKAKLDTPILTYQMAAGGQEGVYYFIVPMASLKALDEEPARMKALMDAMGPDNFRQFMKGAGEVFTSMESQLYAVSPEMSYVSKATEDEDPAFWRPKATAVPSEKPKEAKPKEKTTP